MTEGGWAVGRSGGQAVGSREGTLLTARPLDRPTAWHLSIDSFGRPGAENMALDQALLDDAERTGRSHLRLYRWNPACLSLGRNEPTRGGYDRDLLQRRGVPVVRRPTGGGAVWHEHEVTYAVAAPIELFGSLRAAYRIIHEWLAAGLGTLGVEVSLAGRPERVAEPGWGGGGCFSIATGGELLIGQRKVVGSAQVRQGRALLQHGSILLDGSQKVVDEWRTPPRNAAEVPVAATTLHEALGRPVSFAEVTEALVRQWGIRDSVARSAGPTLSSFARSRFESSDWIWRR